MLHATSRLLLRRASLAALLLGSSLVLGGCGLAESIGEGFVDDQFVTIPHRLDRSGTLVRMADGTELQALPGTLYAGDSAVDAHGLCVFGFSIDPSLQPSNAELDTVILRIWVEPDTGNPDTLGPLLVSHLPGHPDQLLATGQVPHPPGDDVGSVPGPLTVGWRDVNVTTAFLEDWNAGRSISAFAIRFTSATNGDAQADTVAFDGVDGDGKTATTILILRFSLSL